MWHLTGDTWHLKPDTWHQTSDRWHVVGGEHSSKFQLSSYHGSGVMMLWRFWRKSAISDFISDGGDCRTAPATPGLLIKKKIGSISCCYIGSQEVIPCWPRTSSLRNRIRTRKPIPHCTVLKYDRWYVDTWHVIPPMSVHPSLCPSVCPPPKKLSYLQKKGFLLVSVIPSASEERGYVSRHYKCPISYTSIIFGNQILPKNVCKII